MMSCIAASGAVVRDMPGMSKVVTANEVASMAAVLAKLSQSPSPEGMSTTSGPVPRRSTCHDILSLVSTRDMEGWDMLVQAPFGDGVLERGLGPE